MSETDLEVARAAGAQGMRLLTRSQQGRPALPSEVIEKRAGDYCTDLDLRIEEAIMRVIRTARPEDGIVPEESSEFRGVSGGTWYIDPIDGTANLIAGRPEIAVSIARYFDDQPTAAYIAMPLRGLELTASDDSTGVMMNGAGFFPTGAASSLSAATVAIPGDSRKQPRPNVASRLFELLSRNSTSIRITGALAYDLASLVLGELDGRVSFSAKAVDVAAGSLLIAESGGKITDLRGNPWTPRSTCVVAARSPSLHAELLDVVKRIG